MLKPDNQSGFTLMEITVSLVILGVLSIVTYGVIALNANTFKTVENNTIKRWNARNVMQMLEHDIQMISPDDLTGMPGSNNPSNHLFFYNENGQLVQYLYASGNKLKRKVGSGSWSVILENVDTNPFRFLDGNSNATHTKANVRFVEVTLSQTIDSKNYTLRKKFYVRN